MLGVLLRFARAVVSMVMQQLMQQFQVVTDQAMNPMRQMISQVTSGVWVGDGANAFVRDVSSISIPYVGQIGTQITTMNRNLQHAIEVMDRADREVNRMVQGLASNTFANIFRL
jgi:hypothetical protein